MLTLAFVVDGEVDFWLNVFGVFTHCELSDQGVRELLRVGEKPTVWLIIRACHAFCHKRIWP